MFIANTLRTRVLLLGSARVSRAGDRVLAIANFHQDCFGETLKPAREARALPEKS